jgi:capsid assembly protease
MARSYPRVMSLLLNTPLFAHPRAAMVLYNALSGRFGLPAGTLPQLGDADSLIEQRQLHRDRPAPDLSRFEGDFVKADGGDWRRVEPFRLTRDGTGIITVTGEMVNRGAWHGEDSGLTSYEGVKDQMIRAARNPKVKNVLLDLETPGGSAVGCAECSAVVRAVAAEKPVYAVVNGMAASAGYSLASGATRVFTTETGVAGSIGCVMMHLDVSKALESQGITPTLIYAGDRKVDGTPLEPLSESAQAELQREVNSFYQIFVDTVAQGRGRKLSAEAARDTQARTYIGRQAVEAGLADDIASFEEVLSEASAKARKAQARPKDTGAKTMSRLLNDEDTGVSQEQHNAALDAATRVASDKGYAAGHEAGLKVGAEAERGRIKAIVDDPRMAGRETAALALALEAPAMSADAVASFVERHAGAAVTGQAGKTLSDRVAGTGVNHIQPGGEDPKSQGLGTDWKNVIPANRLRKA